MLQILIVCCKLVYFYVILIFIIFQSLAVIKDILEESSKEFENIFNKTLQDTNSNNQLAIQQFFDGLKKFYGDYPIDIEFTIKKVLINLTRILYYLLNNQHHTSKSQQQIIEKCIENNFDKIEPFGSLLPKQIIKQLVKSLEAVKIFTAGLTKTRDLIIDVSSRFHNPSINCKRILTKMTKCSLCVNNTVTLIANKLNSIKPCYSYCLDVFKNCFVADLDQLDSVWNSHLSKKKISFCCFFFLQKKIILII